MIFRMTTPNLKEKWKLCLEKHLLQIIPYSSRWKTSRKTWPLFSRTSILKRTNPKHPAFFTAKHSKNQGKKKFWTTRTRTVLKSTRWPLPKMPTFRISPNPYLTNLLILSKGISSSCQGLALVPPAIVWDRIIIIFKIFRVCLLEILDRGMLMFRWGFITS